MPFAQRGQSLDKVAMILDLPPDNDTLARQLGSKLRSQIRRAERISPEVSIGGAELLDEFYPIFCRTMRDLGTPVYPRRFFDTVLTALDGAAIVLVIRVAGEPVSGAVAVHWRKTLEIPWACTLRRVNPHSVNMRLYWELLTFAVGKGCQKFDFGRSSRDSGTQRFKAQWGALPVQLHWNEYSPNTFALTPSSARPKREFRSAMNVWRRMPVPLANAIGPLICSRLPW